MCDVPSQTYSSDPGSTKTDTISGCRKKSSLTGSVQSLHLANKFAKFLLTVELAAASVETILQLNRSEKGSLAEGNTQRRLFQLQENKNATGTESRCEFTKSNSGVEVA